MLNLCVIIVFLFITIMIIALLCARDTLNILLYLNSLTSLVVLFICSIATYKANGFYLDIAIIYVILSFVAVSGYLRFFMETSSKEKGNDVITNTYEQQKSRN